MSDFSNFPSLQYLETEFTRLEREQRAPLPPSRSRRLVAVALAAAGALVLALTPAGAAVVDWVADVIGIGDPPSRSQETAEQAIVIGVGTSPSGRPFEIVASRDTPGGIGAPTTCITLDATPDAVQPEGLPRIVGACLTRAALMGIEAHGISASAAVTSLLPAPLGTVAVVGLVTDRASDVEVTFTSAGSASPTSVETTFARLEPELAAQIGAAEQLGYYFAFLPAGALGLNPPEATEAEIADLVSGIEVRAIAPSGAVLARSGVDPGSIFGIQLGLGQHPGPPPPPASFP